MSDFEFVLVEQIGFTFQETVFELVFGGARGPAGPTTAQAVGDVIAASDAKPIPADADLIGFSDSEDGDILKSLTFANLWTWIRGLADLVYQPLSSALSKITEAGGLPLWDGGTWPGGGGGSEWTEIDRETVVGGSLTFIEFLNKITDTYDTYRLRIVKGQMNGTGGFAFEIGYGVTPTWVGGSSHVDVRSTNANVYVGESYSSGPMALAKINQNFNWALNSDVVIKDLRDASNNPTFKSKGRQVLAVIANSLSYNAGSFGEVADVTNQFDHIRVTFITGLTTTIKSGIFILEGKNDTI